MSGAGEKPYKCTFCKYATAQNSTLKIHLKRHHLDPSSSTADPPTTTAAETSASSSITCSDCGRCFQRHDALMSHAITEHTHSTNVLPSSAALLPPGGNSSSIGDSAANGRVIDDHHSYAMKQSVSGHHTTSTSLDGPVNNEITNRVES